jgi:hypothetical protein
MAIMLGNDRMGSCQAKSTAPRFRGKVRIKNIREHLWRDARAVILDGNLQVGLLLPG